LATWLKSAQRRIKDMRYGALLEQDWLGFDPDELLTDRCTPATLLPGVAYSVASATLSREPHGLFAHDLLVQHTSAHGIGKVRSIPFDQTRTFHSVGASTTSTCSPTSASTARCARGSAVRTAPERPRTNAPHAAAGGQRRAS